jgi:hypothetical protein
MLNMYMFFLQMVDPIVCFRELVLNQRCIWLVQLATLHSQQRCSMLEPISRSVIMLVSKTGVHNYHV